MIGVGYRQELAKWIATRPREIECLEITAEHFYDQPIEPLQELRRAYPLFVHGLGLSLGTPGPLDPYALSRFKKVVEAAHPLWISEHVAFTRTSEVDLGHLNPVVPSRETLNFFSQHARELSDCCEKPLILENITSHLRLTGDLSESEFLNELCQSADCGVLLDVTNLFINSRNHDFDPLKWLDQLDCTRIVQLHIVGYSQENGRYVDGHAEGIQDDLLSLLSEVLRRAPVRAVILERDHSFPSDATIGAELNRISKVFHAH